MFPPTVRRIRIIDTSPRGPLPGPPEIPIPPKGGGFTESPWVKIKPLSAALQRFPDLAPFKPGP